jgi:hypothetical protein
MIEFHRDGAFVGPDPTVPARWTLLDGASACRSRALRLNPRREVLGVLSAMNWSWKVARSSDASSAQASRSLC